MTLKQIPTYYIHSNKKSKTREKKRINERSILIEGSQGSTKNRTNTEKLPIKQSMLLMFFLSS